MSAVWRQGHCVEEGSTASICLARGLWIKIRNPASIAVLREME
jgi:hypothetical protein